MPGLELDFNLDNGDNDENYDDNIQYEQYETVMKKIADAEYHAIKSRYKATPLMKPHQIHQDFFNNNCPVIVDTQVYLSKSGVQPRSILKNMEISYYPFPASREPCFRRNLEQYIGKVMNEINMQEIADTLQTTCNVKVPKIHNYGQVMRDVSSKLEDAPKEKEHVFLSLKRADSMDANKQTIVLFIEMEYIADSQELTKLLYKSKSQCLLYKAKLEEVFQCLKANGFSHGDMNTLDNILVNTGTGEFALIDYGQSSTSTKGEKFDYISDINCDLATVKGGKSRRRIRRKKKKTKRRKTRKGKGKIKRRKTRKF
jgi:hypothetical protein